MNGAHPTWGGAAAFEGGRWKFLAGSKIARDPGAAPDPFTYWGRQPPYDRTAAEQGQDPFHGAHPWEFKVNASRDPFPDGGTKVSQARDLYEPKSWLSLYESAGGDPGGPYTETVSKWFRAFRADLKRLPNSDALLSLSNAGGGFTIIQSASGKMDGPWTDHQGKALDPAWTGQSPGTTPTAKTRMPPPVYKFMDNGHCSHGWGALTGKYVTRDGGALRECSAAEKDMWNCHLADPALLVHPNGTTIIAYRGTRCESADGHVDHTERLGLLVADRWQGPYTKIETPIFADNEVQNGGLEDLFMWLDERGTHMIVHSQAQDHALNPELKRATFHHKKKRGAYAFSADGVHSWSLSDWELFPSEIRWDDGSVQFLLKQQRPSLIFDPSSGQPTHLVTGVDFIFDPCCDWYAYGSGWTLVQPLVTECPAGEIKVGESCAKCPSRDASYSGRCGQATTKYGSCVCAACSGGYSGDRCEVEPEPVYETRCRPLQADHLCEDMGGTATWLGRATVGAGTCLEDCEAAASSEGASGCCFQFRSAANPSGAPSNCRFFPAQRAIANPASAPEKAAGYCERVRVN